MHLSVSCGAQTPQYMGEYRPVLDSFLVCFWLGIVVILWGHFIAEWWSFEAKFFERHWFWGVHVYTVYVRTWEGLKIMLIKPLFASFGCSLILGFYFCCRVIDKSMKNFKAFFRWLYVGKYVPVDTDWCRNLFNHPVIGWCDSGSWSVYVTAMLRMSDDHVPPELNKVSLTPFLWFWIQS